MRGRERGAPSSSSAHSEEKPEYIFLENRKGECKVLAIGKDANVIRKLCPHRFEEQGTEWQDIDGDGMRQGELGHTHPHHICEACNPFWSLDTQERVKEGVIKGKA